MYIISKWITSHTQRVTMEQAPKNLSAMMQKMYHDGKVCLIAWSYLDKDIQAEHILSRFSSTTK